MLELWVRRLRPRRSIISEHPRAPRRSTASAAGSGSRLLTELHDQGPGVTDGATSPAAVAVSRPAGG